MAKRKLIHVLAICSLLVVFAVETLSQTDGSNQTAKPSDAERWRTMSEQEKKRQVEERRRQQRLEREQKLTESKKRAVEQKRQWDAGAKQRQEERERQREEWDKEKQEAGGFIYEKRVLAGLGVTEEQWELIKPKLEKVRLLRGRANSGVGLFLTSSSGGGSGSGKNATLPTWQWKNPWKNKGPDEMTEAQKLAKQLIALVERKEVAPGTLRRTMDALRKARQQEPEIEKQLVEARRELREGLTPRQEAALVLMRWL